MKRLIFGLVISLIFCSSSYPQEIIYDFDIKKGFEILGTEERPRVIFFIPELKLPLEKRPLEINFTLKENLISKDIEDFLDRYISEEKIK